MSAAPWPAVITDRQHRQAAQTSIDARRECPFRIGQPMANQWPVTALCIPFLAFHSLRSMQRRSCLSDRVRGSHYIFRTSS